MRCRQSWRQFPIGQCECRVLARDDDAAQVRTRRKRMQEQTEVVAIGTRVHQHAAGQAQLCQQGDVLRFDRLRRCVAPVCCQRIAVVGPEQMGVTIPAAGHDGMCWGSGNAGRTPSGSGISCVLSVMATIV
jgi:hypothetical protein